MTSEQQVDSSPQIRALRKCSAKLVLALSAADCLMISWDLFANDLIEQETVDYCQLEVIKTKKSSKIVSALAKTVSASPHLFESLVSVLSKSGNTALTSVGQKLDKLLTEMSCQSHSFHTHPYHQPTVPLVPPIQLQSPICDQYANYLRTFYTRSELSNPAARYKWMRSPAENFRYINLAIIRKEEVNKEEAERIKKETIHGHIDLILKKKSPITIENILQVEQGQSLSCVLIEGAPGIGKSTLSWEICRRWGRREIFQEYSIVLLVTLRDERVQRATCVVDLFYHSDRKLQEEIVQEISKTNGKETLILLEGLDELPKHLLTGYSIFTDLLSGAIFPEATVLVTSRPSATDTLWKKWWQQKLRHIQILGFTDDHIDKYSESMLSDYEISGFKNYLSIHPHIKSMMYVPLHCAIAIAVYLECQQSDRPLPKTLTGLYTCLAQTILKQYLQDHPDYRENDYELNNFSDLPPSVYDHFKKLCNLAFDGVVKQQLIFHSLPQKFEHLEFMDVVPEQSLLSQQSTNYSHNFLHLSVQEYLAAYHTSLMKYGTQEQLLQQVSYGDHRFSMVRFLAGITNLKHLNKRVVKELIGIRSRSKTEVDISDYTLEFLYECQDVSILDSQCCYINVESTYSVHCLMALGYCIAKSSSRWHVIFSGRENSGTEVLCHSLQETPHPTYSIEAIEGRASSPDFLHNFLQYLPEYALKQIRTLSIQHNDTQPLPSCLPRLIPRMEMLNTLKLINILDASLTELMPALSRVTTLRNLQISHRCYTFKMQLPSEDLSSRAIKCVNCASNLLDRILPALPQQATTHIQSLTIDYKREYDVDGQCRAQPLPSCMLKLVPQMTNLHSLSFTTVLDETLVKLMPLVPITRSLTLNITLCQILSSENFSYGTFRNNYCVCTCTSAEVIDKLLRFLPQQLMVKIQKFQVSHYTVTSIPLPPCLPELISRMNRLHTLTLKNIPATSLTKLIPVLSNVITLRNLTLHELNSEGTVLLCQWLPTCQLEELTLIETFPTKNIKICFHNNFIDAITCQYNSTEFINNILSQIPPQLTVHVKILTISNQHEHDQLLPSCLPELISRMEKLNTLTLKQVLVTSPMKLMSALSRVPNLKNLLIANSQCTFQMDDPTSTIDSTNCTFLDQLLPVLPKQNIAHTKSLRMYCRDQPLPSSLFELIPQMKTLDSLYITTILNDTLTQLMQALPTVSITKRLVLNVTLQDMEEFTYRTLENICTCTCTSPTTIDRLLQFLPQQHIIQVQALHVIMSSNIPKALPLCLPEVVARMKRLNTLIIKNVLHTSLKELFRALSSVPTLRKLTLPKLNLENIAFLCQWLPTCKLETLFICKEICDGSHSENIVTTTFISNSIEAINFEYCPTEFLGQFLSQILQESIAHVKTLTINMCNYTLPIPSCLPKLTPTMKNLHTLTLECLLDKSLTELIPALSKAPKLRNLRLPRLNSSCSALLCQCLPKYQLEKLTIGEDYLSKIVMFFCNNSMKSIECLSNEAELTNQILSQIPQQSITSVNTLTVTYRLSDPHQILPPCLLDVIPRMKKLNTLTLNNVLDTSLTELIPALSKVPTLRNLTLPKLSTEGITHLCQWLPKCQLKKLAIIYSDFDTSSKQATKMLPCMIVTFYRNSIEAIKFQNCLSEFLSQILLQIPQQSVADVKTLTIDSQYTYCRLSLPHCLSKLIPKMRRLYTLTLVNVLDISLTELLPVLFEVHTLRNLALHKLDSNGIALLCQRLSTCKLETLILFEAFDTQFTSKIKMVLSNSSILTIECQYCTAKFTELILSQIPQQCTTHTNTLSILDCPPSTTVFASSAYLKIEQLSTQETKNASLVKLILSSFSALRNLTLPQMNSEGIDLFCQWLLTCRLETLKLQFLSSVNVEVVLSSLTTVSSLKTLSIQSSKITSQGMQAVGSLFQQNQLLSNININHCSIDSAGCLIGKLHHNMRKLDISSNSVGERRTLAISKMFKQNTTLEELYLNDAAISSDGTVAIAESLQHNTTLRVLCMNRNPMREKGALAIAKMIEHNTTLEELYLSSTMISSAGTAAITDSLQHNTTLRKINMSGNSVGEVGALAIAEMFNYNATLEELYLSHAEINSVGAIAIAEALHHNTALRTLDMRWNPVGESEALAMAEMLKYNNTLEELGLSEILFNADIGTIGIKALVEILAVNQHLKKLTISSNYKDFVTYSLPSYNVHKERVIFERIPLL